MEEIRRSSAAEQGRLSQRGQLSATELRRSVTQNHRLAAGMLLLLNLLLCNGRRISVKGRWDKSWRRPHWVGVAALRYAGVGRRGEGAQLWRRQLESAGYDFIGKGACPSTFERSLIRLGRAHSHWGSVVLRRLVERWIGLGRARPVAHGSDATICVSAVSRAGVADFESPPAGCRACRTATQFQRGVTLALARHAENSHRDVVQRLRVPFTPAGTKALRVGMLDHDPEVGLARHHAPRRTWPAVFRKGSQRVLEMVVSAAEKMERGRWTVGRGQRCNPAGMFFARTLSGVERSTRSELDRRFFQAVEPRRLSQRRGCGAVMRISCPRLVNGSARDPSTFSRHGLSGRRRRKMERFWPRSACRGSPPSRCLSQSQQVIGVQLVGAARAHETLLWSSPKIRCARPFADIHLKIWCKQAEAASTTGTAMAWP